MSEIFFVVKVLVITAIVTTLGQVRIGGATIEDRASYAFTRSAGAEWVQSVAAGGALAVVNLAKSVKTGIAGTVDGFQEGAREQRAGR